MQFVVAGRAGTPLRRLSTWSKPRKLTESFSFFATTKQIYLSSDFGNIAPMRLDCGALYRAWGRRYRTRGQLEVPNMTAGLQISSLSERGQFSTLLDSDTFGGHFSRFSLSRSTT